MEARYFTVEEANVLLPIIRPLMAELLERRAKVARTRSQLPALFGRGSSDIGGPLASGLVREFAIIERRAKQIRSFGCLVRDLNTGLVDFLSEQEGREVFLCWRYGEPQIDFYHELHTGFAGRQRLVKR